MRICMCYAWYVKDYMYDLHNKYNKYVYGMYNMYNM